VWCACLMKLTGTGSGEVDGERLGKGCICRRTGMQRHFQHTTPYAH
jgi:hypothetical protein